jgi:hypothetical protein
MHEIIGGTERRFSYDYDQREQLTEETEWLPDEIDWLEGTPNTYDHAQNRATAVKSSQSIYETYVLDRQQNDQHLARIAIGLVALLV